MRVRSRILKLGWCWFLLATRYIARACTCVGRGPPDLGAGAGVPDGANCTVTDGVDIINGNTLVCNALDGCNNAAIDSCDAVQCTASQSCEFAKMTNVGK